MATMTMELLLVSPEMARKFLTKNPRNRPLSPGLVKKYVRVMTADGWVKNHPEGLSFDVHGNLVNGQHRCSAIIEIGKPVWMVVFRNVSEESLAIFDAGRPRSVPQRISIESGIKDPKINQIVPRFVVGGYVTQTQESPLTEREMSEVLLKYIAELQLANEWLQGAAARLNQVAIRATVARALVSCGQNRAARARIEDFCKTIVVGRYQQDGDGAAIALRDALLSRPAFGGSAHSFDVYQKAQSALRSFIDRVDRSTATAATGPRELFPIDYDEQWVPADNILRNAELCRQFNSRLKLKRQSLNGATI